MSWAADSLGGAIQSVQALHDDQGPWRLSVGARHFVLRAPTPRIDATMIATGAAALSVAERYGLPAPRLVGEDVDGVAAGVPATLETVAGSTTWPRALPVARIRAARAALARVHAIALEPSRELPLRTRPIAVDDFAADRREGRMATTPLLLRADELIRGMARPLGETVFVHGDVWPGNIAWAGDRCTLIDWKTAGVGDPGVDVGELRKQLAITYGPEATNGIPAGCTREAGGLGASWTAMTADLGQQELIERAARVLGQDERVLGVWLVGSYGRGTEDRFSDVDLWVVVSADDADGFCDDWPKLVDQVAPTVYQRALGRRVFNQITPEWLRFDVTVGTPDDLSRRTRTTAKPIYDPDNLSANLSEPAAPKQPDPERVESITREFLRVLGLLPVAVGREEYVVGESGAGLLRQMLIDLMLEEVAVEDRGGALHLNPLLPPDRRQLLADLPPLQATREAVIAANVACAAAFLPLARTLHTRCALPWPEALENAARRHILKTLEVDIPA